MNASPTTTKSDLIWGIVFALAALFLFYIDLGGVPLRDWDEGTVAQVAKEMSRSDTWSTWLHPQLWGQPYLNKPPLMHSLIAGVFNLWGVHTWTARLPGATLTALSVPMLFLLCRELFTLQLYAVMSTGVYLTLLPVVRHGRLAMLDGAVVAFFIALLWFLLRSRRQPKAYIGIGICFALMCLTKGILGLLLLAIALLFLLWDEPKALLSPHLWASIALGSLLVIGWYFLQWQFYGQQFINVTLLNQNFERVWDSVDNHQGPLWYYLLELLKYSWPWLIFCPTGIWLTVKSRHQSWAKLLWVWAGGYGLAISLMGTKLPWYIYPLYPALAMICGVALTATWRMHQYWNGRDLALKRIPQYWSVLLALFSVGGGGGIIYASPWGGEPALALLLTFLTLMVTTCGAALLASRQQTQFIPTLLVGLYIALICFVNSDHWVWELGEAFPVMPMADLVNANVSVTDPIYIADFYDRPSLDFYCDRRVVAQPSETLASIWQQTSPVYILTKTPTFFQTSPQPLAQVGVVEDWALIVNQTATANDS
ncbi:MAG: ArnT family glycosyltransferase [Leptolyngbyaceae cyanobacterium]